MEEIRDLSEQTNTAPKTFIGFNGPQLFIEISRKAI